MMSKRHLVNLTRHILHLCYLAAQVMTTHGSLSFCAFKTKPCSRSRRAVHGARTPCVSQKHMSTVICATGAAYPFHPALAGLVQNCGNIE